jgi:hypothetical protein
MHLDFQTLFRTKMRGLFPSASSSANYHCLLSCLVVSQGAMWPAVLLPAGVSCHRTPPSPLPAEDNCLCFIPAVLIWGDVRSIIHDGCTRRQGLIQVRPPWIQDTHKVITLPLFVAARCIPLSRMRNFGSYKARASV